MRISAIEKSFERSESRIPVTVDRVREETADVSSRRSRQADHYDEPIRRWFDGASHLLCGHPAFCAADDHSRRYPKSAHSDPRASAIGCGVHLDGDGQVRGRRLELQRAAASRRYGPSDRLSLGQEGQGGKIYVLDHRLPADRLRGLQRRRLTFTVRGPLPKRQPASYCASNVVVARRVCGASIAGTWRHPRRCSDRPAKKSPVFFPLHNLQSPFVPTTLTTHPHLSDPP